MKRLLIPLALIGVLTTVGCNGGGANSVLQPAAQTYVIESTSTSPYPGTLEHFQIATNFTTTNLLTSVNDDICPANLTGASCTANHSNLQSDFAYSSQMITSITDSVQAYSIQYNTPGAHGENRSVSGGVLIPNLAESQIKGIIIYYHQTEVTKYTVPSCFDGDMDKPSYCLGHAAPYGQEVGGTLASQGYIVIMPDYVGQGLDNMVIHPYALYTNVNAYSGLNMLTATESLLVTLGYTKAATNLYVTGFSEGAAYALWTAKLLQTSASTFLSNNNLTLKSSVGVSGAYDLTNAQLPLEAANVTTENDNPFLILNTLTATGGKPVLIGYLLSAYGFYNQDQNYSQVFSQGFYYCYTCLLNGGVTTIPVLFNTPDRGEDEIKEYVISSAASTGYGLNSNNSAYALVYSGLLTNANFLAQVNGADIVNWSSNSPVYIVHLSKDSVVTPLNSQSAYAGINANSPTMARDINIVNIPTTVANITQASHYYYHDFVSNTDTAIDHTETEPFALIAILYAIESGV